MSSGDLCIRRKVVVGKENYYLAMGENFIHVTIPDENHPDREHERLAMEKICEEINKVRGKIANGETYDTYSGLGRGRNKLQGSCEEIGEDSRGSKSMGN